MPGPQDIDNLQKEISSVTTKEVSSDNLIESYKSHQEALKKIAEYTEQYVKYNKENKEVAGKIKDIMQDLKQYYKDISKEVRETYETDKDLNMSLEEKKLKAADLLIATREVNLEMRKMQQEEREASADKKAESEEERARAEEEAKIKKSALEWQQSATSNMAKAVSEANLEFAKSAPLLAKIQGTSAQVLTGHQDAASSAKSLISSVTSLIPGSDGGIGGILGLMLFGKAREMEYAAAGQAAAQQFDQVGGNFENLARKMAGHIRALSVASIATKEDFVAMNAAFASGSMNSKELYDKPVEGFKGVGGANNLAAVTLGLDKHLELAGGSMGKMSAIMHSQFNMSAKESIMLLSDMVDKSEKLHVNQVQMAQSTLEASSAFKLMGVSVKDISNFQVGLTDHMIKRFGGEGHEGAGQAYAQQGVASAARGIAGLDVGMSAYLGEKLKFGSGLDAYVAMKDPLAKNRNGTDNKDIFSKSIVEMAKLARENSGDEAEQLYFLQKTMGVDIPGARAVLEGADDAAAHGGKMSEGKMAAAQKGLETEGQKLSAIENYLKEIRNAFAELGVSLIEIITGGFKALIQGLMFVAGTIKGLKPGENDVVMGSSAADWGNLLMNETLPDLSDSVSSSVDAGGRVLSGIGKIAKIYMGNTKWRPDMRAKSKEQKTADRNEEAAEYMKDKTDVAFDMIENAAQYGISIPMAVAGTVAGTLGMDDTQKQLADASRAMGTGASRILKTSHSREAEARAANMDAASASASASASKNRNGQSRIYVTVDMYDGNERSIPPGVSQ